MGQGQFSVADGHACRAVSPYNVSNPPRAEQVPDSGYAGVRDVTVTPVELDDTMQSFWLAETLKYAWLTFAPPDALDLRTRVLNTEARRPQLRVHSVEVGKNDVMPGACMHQFNTETGTCRPTLYACFGSSKVSAFPVCHVHCWLST